MWAIVLPCFQYSPSSLFPVHTAMAYPTHAPHLSQTLLPHTRLLHSSSLHSAHPSQPSTEHLPGWRSYTHPPTVSPPDVYHLPLPLPEGLPCARGLHVCARTQTDLSSMYEGLPLLHTAEPQCTSAHLHFSSYSAIGFRTEN